MKYLWLPLLFVLGLNGCNTAVTSEPQAGQLAQVELYLASKTPYQPQQPWQDYSPPPAGFTPVMVQHVARHGSRLLSSAGDDDLALQLWNKAQQLNGLTPLGEQLGPVLEQLYQVHQHIGYGSISGLGIAEHHQMAERLLARYAPLFSEAPASGQRIAVTHSGRKRAAQSADAFVQHLLTLQPALQPLIDEAKADEHTLYFNKTEGSEGYEHYKDNDPRLLQVMQQLTEQPKTEQMAQLMLARLFSEAFIARLAQGEFSFTLSYDDDEVNSPTDAAMLLYSLYNITSNMPAEGDWQFQRFVLPEHAAWFAELDDADSFYGRGPAFAGDDITYRLARNLVEDMLARIAEPANYVAALRFTHAQALMPLAAYLGIKDASEPLAVGTAYSYQSSSWRSALVSPMAANVQWDAYRNTEGEVVVRMLHQEREVLFGRHCQPVTPGSYFYHFKELQRCLL
ncbi:histidine-type phosphatase [Arsukibacterium sp. MJ3]|uniref:histidine-type phosphatase n=1 Tax=Arsukibacterium sp. MJ3 TaxID=1632859 RepID=UPI00069B1796|nr:histidine-type phosphatase [Arsukibacterium sp. MJ3]